MVDLTSCPLLAQLPPRSNSNSLVLMAINTANVTQLLADIAINRSRG
jgi:hypothetical protein